MSMNKYIDLNIELPPWPHIDAGPCRVQVSAKRYLFGRLIVGHKNNPLTTVLVGRRVYQVPKEDVRV